MHSIRTTAAVKLAADLGLGLCRAYRIAKLHDGEITWPAGRLGCVATIAINSGD